MRARACPSLVAVEAEPAEEARLLERLCDWCSRFTPLAALDGADGLMLDISGVAHLFEGEAALAEDCLKRLAAQGIAARRRRRRQSARGLSAGAVFEPKNRARDFKRQGLRQALPRPAARGARPRRQNRRRHGAGGPEADRRHRAQAPRADHGAVRAVPMARLDALKGLERSSIAPRFMPPDFCAERRFASPIADGRGDRGDVTKSSPTISWCCSSVRPRARGGSSSASIGSTATCAASGSAPPGR